MSSDERLLDRAGHGEAWRRLTGEAQICRTWGDCYGYALVATGRAEAIVDPVLGHWDAAPMLPILQEAGGVATDFQGRVSARTGSLIATNGPLAAPIRDLLGVPA